MRRGNGETILEPARHVPVYGHCEVLVVGGGPAGTAAAVAAAREGTDVVLLERYGCLGGLSTGGLVCWIDRMTDWDGRLVVAGIGRELIERCGPDAVLGPPRELWGSRDPEAVAYWGARTSAQRGVVNWAPTVDPEVLKCVSNDIVREAGVHVLFHCWVVSAVCEGERVRGVIFESKEGRFALLARVVVDCTGDGDVFAFAGAEFESDVDHSTAHARLNTSFRLGNVDMRRFLEFRVKQPEEYLRIMGQAAHQDVWLNLQPHPTPYDSVALFLTPKFSGYSALKIADLTEVEFRSRDVMRQGLAWFRANVPGFEHAWVLDTAAQIGTRHGRRLVGVEKVTIEHWRQDGRYPDSIGLCPGLTPEFPTLQIPYRCLVPRRIDGLLAAGRNLSADTGSHLQLREIPECWVMGQAAGVAAALAVRDNVPPRAISVAALQERLRRQGAIVDRPEPATPPVPSGSATTGRPVAG